MQLRPFICSLFLLTSFISPVFAASVTPYTDLFVFGDSLSDTGNAFLASGGLFPGSNYAPGRFTNGPNTTPATTGPFGLWVDQLATKLGVADPQPFLAGGTNYAVASAMTGSNGLDGISDQINYFLGQHLTGASPTALYAIWGGANDLFFGNTSPTTAADNLYKNIQTLAADGGKSFLWLNLPPLGNTPRAGQNNAATALNAASMAFNNEWSLDLALLQAQGINVTGVDLYGLFTQVALNPGAYGFSNLTTPAQGLAGVNPNSYLFWDQEHPTTAGHALVANLAYNDLTPSPEPMSVAITALGLGALLAGARVRRSR